MAVTSIDRAPRLGAVTCPSCGKELPGEFPFCPFCGAALGAEPNAGREERKVVTVIFVDLVGFTARSETLDPEDVRALLGPYHARLRADLERHGGTVEKFIGDAVMALFGAPVTREDDPERAVRAALAIRAWAEEQRDELQVRIGVNTGEALVALDARPNEGESMASGDVVNTAARLQAAASLNGILVGEHTYRATADAIVYREAGPVTAKGKSTPIPVWEPVEARSRFGVDLSPRSSAELVGRGRDLELLISTLDRAREERRPQLVTLVGVPGIGKSRLVSELFRTIDQDVEFVRWRQGRSLPYGEGVTFWALSEIVKAEAGILESDTLDLSEEKLRASVDRVVSDGAEADWVYRQLRPLVGLAEDGAGSQEESFAAWRRFLEALAEEEPLVLALEDLHWADDALLDFVDGLVDRAGGVPMLVLGSARPELLERRSGWGGGKPNSLTISLSPLSDAETARLVRGLLDGSRLDSSTEEALLVRAGGNPLYAEQYARVLQERGDVLELPESVQGIIAARLDALSEEEKMLLQDAAVVGKVFWLGAATTVGGAPRRQAEEMLHSLERKEFVQRARASSVASDTEYAFRHVLIRDVAYGQIPRALRSTKHERVAAWINGLGRPEERAEMLAHHYLQALDLAQAAGLDAEALRTSARKALRDAGDRAAALYSVDAAERFYDEALELCPDDGPERADLLFRRAVPVGHHVGGGDLDRLEAARDALLAIGDDARAAEAEILVAQTYWMQGRRKPAGEHARRALALVSGGGPSRSRAWVLIRNAAHAGMVGEHDPAVAMASEAYRTSEALGYAQGMSEALNVLGIQRLYNGDPGGLEDIERSVRLARDARAAGSLTRALNSLSVAHQVGGDIEASYAARLEAAQSAVRTGSETLMRWFGGALCDHRYRLGDWDAALETANGFLATVESGTPNVASWQAYCIRAEIRLARGDLDGAVADSGTGLDDARAVGEIQSVTFALASAAHVLALAARQEPALRLTRELLDTLQAGVDMQFAVVNLPLFTATADRLGLLDELAAAVADRPTTPWTDVVRAYAAGDFVAAADILHRVGSKPDEAEARLRASRDGDADDELERALAFYRSVGADHFVRECEAPRTG
jgi:class 3 adenylate cyclase/tetratricopeptide (TPR) repeat protein